MTKTRAGSKNVGKNARGRRNGIRKSLIRRIKKTDIDRGEEKKQA